MEQESRTEEPKQSRKPLTASLVVQRVRGCGEPQAAAILAATKADQKAIVDAYADGAAAVEAVLNEAHDKAFPPKDAKKDKQQPPAPSK